MSAPRAPRAPRPPPVQLGRHGTAINADDAELRRLRLAFATHRYVKLPQLVDPHLAARLIAQIERSDFTPLEHPGIGVELTIDAGDAPVGALAFLTNSPELFGVVTAITGRAPIRIFRGRVFRMTSSPEHFDKWHDDCEDQRLVGMSINLSPTGYSGGALLLRSAAGEDLPRVTNPTAGDAVLFDISHDLEHRVEAVRGHRARTAFAGWFCAGPDYMRLLRGELDEVDDRTVRATAHRNRARALRSRAFVRTRRETPAPAARTACNGELTTALAP